MDATISNNNSCNRNTEQITQTKEEVQQTIPFPKFHNQTNLG